MRRWGVVLAATLALAALAGCAAGPGSDWAKPEAAPAGFFAGFWHGLILVLTLIVSFFTDQVRIYEVQNVGIAYDIGFVLGAMATSGGGIHITKSGKRRHVRREVEDDVADEVERRVKAKIASVLDDDDWKDLGQQVEQKIKSKLRRWLEEDDRRPGR